MAPSPEDTLTCACAALCRDGKFLVGRRSPHKRLYPGVWDLPGGHVQAGEAVEAALVREILEEIGVVPTSYRLAQVLTERDPGAHGHRVYHVFLVSQWTGGEPRLCNGEHTELRWCDANEAEGLELADDRYLHLFRQVGPRTGSGASPATAVDGPTPDTQSG